MLGGYVSGNVGKDSELRNAGNSQVLSFSVASTDTVKGTKTTTWVKCAMFGARGVSLQQHITKGTRVVATGKYSLNTYTNNTTGKEVTSLELNVSDIDLMGGGERQGGGHQSGGNQQGNQGGGYGTRGGQGNDGGNQQDGGHRRQQTRQQQTPASQQDGYDESGGGGGGFGNDDDIPFVSCDLSADPMIHGRRSFIDSTLNH